MLLRPVGEHLPGTDCVQLLDAVEEEAARCGVGGGARGRGRGGRMCGRSWCLLASWRWGRWRPVATTCQARRPGAVAPVKVPGSASAVRPGVRSSRAGRPGARAGTAGSARRAGAPRLRRQCRGAWGAGRREVGPARRRRRWTPGGARCCAPRAWRPRRPWRSRPSTDCSARCCGCVTVFPPPRPGPWACLRGGGRAGVEPFLVAVATLSMLTAAAEENARRVRGRRRALARLGLADALFFCARRLGADRVVMVFAAREDSRGDVRPAGASRDAS